VPIWYVSRLVRNACQPVFDRVQEAVHFLNFAQCVPLARFSTPRDTQRKVEAGKGTHQRYLFLRVDAATREQAVEFLDTICRVANSFARSAGAELKFGDRLLPVNPDSIPLPVEPLIWHFSRGVHTKHDKQSSWRVPPSPRRQEENTGDPLGSPEPSTPSSPQEADPVALIKPAPTLVFRANGDLQGRQQRLLLWLSAAGQGSWDRFVRVSNQLGTSHDSITARRLLRRLILLGHVESSLDGHHWSATPAALVQLAADPTRAFWCGQRSELLRCRLRQVWQMPLPDPQAGSDGPPRWLVNCGEARDPGVVLKARGLPLRWEGTAAENLVRRLPALDRWRDSLLRVSLTPPERVQRWQAGAYRDEITFRVIAGCPQGPTGLYRLFYGDDRSSFELTGFLDAGRNEFLRGDWYGLRFLASRQSGLPCPARWLAHEGRSILVLPLSRRWPLLYERALVLASGLLPIQDSDRLCYLDVPFDLASTLARLLGVTLL
jgi:hypothetical protein